MEGLAFPCACGVSYGKPRRRGGCPELALLRRARVSVMADPSPAGCSQQLLPWLLVLRQGWRGAEPSPGELPWAGRAQLGWRLCLPAGPRCPALEPWSLLCLVAETLNTDDLCGTSGITRCQPFLCNAGQEGPGCGVRFAAVQGVAGSELRA